MLEYGIGLAVYLDLHMILGNVLLLTLCFCRTTNIFIVFWLFESAFRQSRMLLRPEEYFSQGEHLLADSVSRLHDKQGTGHTVQRRS